MMPVYEAVLSDVHILIVEDNPDELRLLVERLRSSGCRISVAFDGVQGYNRAVAGLPDIILLDVSMPRLDGYALCRKLKATPSTAAIPVIFLSAGNAVDQRLTGLYSGACDYIIKPYSIDEVLARIRIHLSLASWKTKAPAAQPAGISSPDQILVGTAECYLREHLADPISLEGLARLLGTNEKRLTRAFRTCKGTTVFEYLRQERMRVARRLLVESTLSVVAISEELGFSSAANFSTAFHKHFGSPPSIFRQSSRSAFAKQAGILQDL